MFRHTSSCREKTRVSDCPLGRGRGGLGQVQLAVGSSFPVSTQGDPIFHDSSDPKVLLSYYHPQHDPGAVGVFFRNRLHRFLPSPVKRCPALWGTLRREGMRTSQRQSSISLCGQQRLRRCRRSALLLPSLWPNAMPRLPLGAAIIPDPADPAGTNGARWADTEEEPTMTPWQEGLPEGNREVLAASSALGSQCQAPPSHSLNTFIFIH